VALLSVSANTVINQGATIRRGVTRDPLAPRARRTRKDERCMDWTFQFVPGPGGCCRARAPFFVPRHEATCRSSESSVGLMIAQWFTLWPGSCALFGQDCVNSF
jgi:hypothetical protein